MNRRLHWVYLKYSFDVESIGGAGFVVRTLLQVRCQLSSAHVVDHPMDEKLKRHEELKIAT